MITVDAPPEPRIPDAGATLPRAPQTEQTRVRRPIKPLLRMAGLVAVVVIALFLLHERVIATLMFDQRQEHLSAEMKSGTPTIEAGEAVAILQAVDIDLNVVVIEGVSTDNLRGAPGRVPESAMPGDAGVTVIFGHRRAWGGPFADIADLVANQSVVVQSRSGGPITRYIVERVERDTSIGTIDLANEDRLAYLLLVTNESSWTSNEQTIVVARALPVTDAEAVIPQLAAVSPRDVPYGLGVLAAVLAGVAATLSWIFLRGRTSTAVRVLVVAPGAAYAAIGVLMTLDGLLPLAR